MKNTANKKIRRILFLNPKVLYRPWPVPDDFTRYFIRIPNVTYPLLAASIRDIPDIEVEIRDFLFEEITNEKYRELIRNSDIFCINAMADVIALNIEVNIELIKRINPRSVIILGGHHATFFAEDWLKRGADFIVLREGEKSFPKLIRNLVNNETDTDIDGVMSKRTADKNKFVDRTKNIENLDETPFPMFELTDYRYYNLSRFHKGYTASIETSRGCVHNCSFCTIPVYWGNRQRIKSSERVIEEIKYLYRLGIRQIGIIDDNFFASPERDFGIFEYLVKNGFNDILFGSFLRADHVIRYPELIKMAAKAGLRKVFVGLESDNPEDIDKMGKHIGSEYVERYPEIYQTLHNLGIYVYGFYLTGFPFQERIRLPRKKVADILLYSDWKPRKFTRMSDKYNSPENFYWLRFTDQRKFDLVKSMTYFLVTLDPHIFRKDSSDHLANMLYGYYDTMKHWNFYSFVEFIHKLQKNKNDIVSETVRQFKEKTIKDFGL